MYLKLLALLTTIIFLILLVLGFIFKIPIAYVPQNPSLFEFMIYHIVFMIVETLVLLSLFLHMLITADIDLDTESLKKMFSREKIK